MRHFRQLSKTQIMELVAMHHAGETHTEIAVKFEVDRSTVSYHITKYEQAYPEQPSFYAALKARIKKTCIHPSSRCTICGFMRDDLARQERETIETLTKQLNEANSRLRIAGLAAE